MKKKTNKGKKYKKSLSLYPLKAEQAIGLFMKIKVKKHKG